VETEEWGGEGENSEKEEGKKDGREWEKDGLIV